MYCSKCGSLNSDDSAFCGSCGAPLAVREPSGAEETVIQVQPTRHEHSKNAAIAVVIMILFACLGYYFVDNYGNTAYIAVYVTSTYHVTEDVDVQIIVDDEVLATWTDISPGSTWHTTKYIPYRFGVFHSSALATVKVIATGGGLGTTSDSEQIIVEDGEYYTVHLYV